MRWLDELAECSEDPAELTRRYLTPEHARAAELIMLRMREAGMSARLDAVGNVVGSFPGGRPGARRLILGSHLDTVRNAGKYDGALGVMLPIACLRSLHAQGRQLDYPVDVIAFGDEEGLRFQATLFGSRAVAGDLDRAMLQAVDEDGVHLREAMREFGLDPDAVGDASYSPDDVAAYVEVHIEQGPVLEAEDLPVGVVTSIAGAVRLRVEVMGRAGHAGTVPMNLRRDALAAASEAVIAIRADLPRHPGHGGHRRDAQDRVGGGQRHSGGGRVHHRRPRRERRPPPGRSGRNRRGARGDREPSRRAVRLRADPRDRRPSMQPVAHAPARRGDRGARDRGAQAAERRGDTTPWRWPTSPTSGCSSCAARKGSATIPPNP